jgi:hypothetical protein
MKGVSNASSFFDTLDYYSVVRIYLCGHENIRTICNRFPKAHVKRHILLYLPSQDGPEVAPIHSLQVVVEVHTN